MNNIIKTIIGLVLLAGIVWLGIWLSKKQEKSVKEEIEKKDDCCSPKEKPKKKKELKIEDIEKTDEVVEEVNTESEKGD